MMRIIAHYSIIPFTINGVIIRKNNVNFKDNLKLKRLFYRA